MTIDVKLKSYEELQFEITRLITDNYLKQQKIEYLQNRIKELEEINKQHQELNSELREENKELKEYKENATRKHWQQKCAEHSINEKLLQIRIDKAIKYINQHKEKLHHSFDEPDCDYWIATNPDNLLNILQGSDKE